MKNSARTFIHEHFFLAFVPVVILATVGLWLIYESTAIRIQIHLEDQVLLTQTHARTVSAVLRSEGIEIDPEDHIHPSPDAKLVDGDRISVTKSHPVIIQTEDQIFQTRSVGKNPADILHQAGILIVPGDRVWVDGLPAADPTVKLLNNPSRILLREADQFEITHSGSTFAARSAAPTAAEGLWENGFEIYEGDEMQPSPATPLRKYRKVEIRRSQPIEVVQKDKSIRSRVVADQVGNALSKIGLPAIGLDYSLPELTAPLSGGGSITLVRVAEKVIIEQEPLPFSTEYRPLEDLELDNLQLVERGQYGIRANRLRIRIQDGEEIDRITEGEWVAQEATPEIMGYGSKIVVRSTATDSGSIDYWRAIEMYATSYSPSRAGVAPDHPWFGITASGKPLTKGLVAIDRRYIPFGTRLYIPGYGFAEAADTGGGIKGRWIDLGYDDDNWVSWHQYVTVYFLTPVPDPSNIVYVIP
jgi:uncharacterized protein YabE (DUF348 family)